MGLCHIWPACKKAGSLALTHGSDLQADETFTLTNSLVAGLLFDALELAGEGLFFACALFVGEVAHVLS